MRADFQSSGVLWWQRSAALEHSSANGHRLNKDTGGIKARLKNVIENLLFIT